MINYLTKISESTSDDASMLFTSIILTSPTLIKIQPICSQIILFVHPVLMHYIFFEYKTFLALIV